MSFCILNNYSNVKWYSRYERGGGGFNFHATPPSVLEPLDTDPNNRAVVSFWHQLIAYKYWNITLS